MSKYSVYIELYGHKLKVNVEAESEKRATAKVLANIRVNKVVKNTDDKKGGFDFDDYFNNLLSGL